MAWKLKRVLKDILAHENGYYLYPPGTRTSVALVYPNSYFVGMSNLGFHIIYDILNKRSDTACERFFLPTRQHQDDYRIAKSPLLSIETQRGMPDFAVIAFTVSFEMDYFNILKILELGNVEAIASKRNEREPLIIAGGPCATFNPEPLSLFIDAFIIGEGEETINYFMDVYLQGMSHGLRKKEILASLAVLPGVYVPSFYEHIYDEQGHLSKINHISPAPSTVERQWVHDIDDYPAHTVIVTDDTEFNMYLIETARGCGRHCRFCMAGYCFRKPRNHSLASLQKQVSEAKAYKKKIGLMGAAISDYPEIDRLCHDIAAAGLDMSVASFRADSVTAALVDALAASGLRTLTLAPEAGSARLRAVINKGITEDDLRQAMTLGLRAGIKNYRLYIMIGLPFETQEDIQGIVDMALMVKEYMQRGDSSGKLTLSINPFVPKPMTPFQWMPMAQVKQVQESLKYIKKALRPHYNIEIIAESPREMWVQGILARGDRHIASVLLTAYEAGGAKHFKQSFKSAGLDDDFYLYRERNKDEVFPWETLSMGPARNYLYNELLKSKDGRATQQCFDGCRKCGVCQ